MKHPLTTIGLLSAAMLATAAPTFAALLQGERMPPQHAQAEPGGRHEHRAQRPGRHHFDRQDERRGGRHHERRGPSQHGLDLAARLAAAETYVGVTSAQEDAWRAYTSALISFFDRPAPPAQEARPDVPQPAPLFTERLAGRAIEQGEKAQALKDAAEALRAALSDEQLGRLARAEEAFSPRHVGPRGPHGGPLGGPRGGPDGGPQRPAAGQDAPPPPAED